MGDRQGRPSAVTLCPFVGVDFCSVLFRPLNLNMDDLRFEVFVKFLQSGGVRALQELDEAAGDGGKECINSLVWEIWFDSMMDGHGDPL